ncbi:MAG: nucleotidyltransferase substrate binding protein, partial [Cyanobacteriota bacterium]|nr:nucleotidyltransferase substrate binding protein [Cyanobacteriota bacterium]
MIPQAVACMATIEEFPRFPSPLAGRRRKVNPLGWIWIKLIKAATSAEDTMSEPQLRWRQRLENLQRALGQLEAALQAQDADPESEVIGMAVIKAYEFSFALSWK